MSNNARSRAARAYMRTHPGTKYTEALRAVTPTDAGHDPSAVPMPVAQEFYPAAATLAGQAQIAAAMRLGRTYPGVTSATGSQHYVLGHDAQGEAVTIDPGAGHTLVSGPGLGDCYAVLETFVQQADRGYYLGQAADGALYLRSIPDGEYITRTSDIADAVYELSACAISDVQRVVLGIDAAVFAQEAASGVSQDDHARLAAELHRVMRLGRSLGIQVVVLKTPASPEMPQLADVASHRVDLELDESTRSVRGRLSGPSRLRSEVAPIPGASDGSSTMSLREVFEQGVTLITGETGSGKTSLAQEVLASFSSWFCISASVEEPGGYVVLPMGTRIDSLQALDEELTRRLSVVSSISFYPGRLLLRDQFQQDRVGVVFEGLDRLRDHVEVRRLLDRLSAEGPMVGIYPMEADPGVVDEARLPRQVDPRL